MGDSLSQTLLEARKLANTDPDRARAMFEALAGTSPCGSWSEAQVELAYLAYHQWRLDEVAFRANAVLSLSDVATPWATAVAGVLTNLAADWSDGPVDEDLLLRSAIACVDANDPYNAAVARSLVASSRLRAGDRRAAIGHLRAAADLYEAAGSMTGGAGVLLRLSDALVANRDIDGAAVALQRGLAHLATFPYGGQDVRKLTEKVRAAELALRGARPRG